MTSTEREMGELSARVKNLEDWLGSIAGDVKAIRSAVDQGRGGWKALVVMCGLAGTIGGLAMKFIPFGR